MSIFSLSTAMVTFSLVVATFSSMDANFVFSFPRLKFSCYLPFLLWMVITTYTWLLLIHGIHCLLHFCKFNKHWVIQSIKIIYLKYIKMVYCRQHCCPHFDISSILYSSILESIHKCYCISVLICIFLLAITGMKIIAWNTNPYNCLLYIYWTWQDWNPYIWYIYISWS